MGAVVRDTVERVCALLGNVTPDDIMGRSRVYRIAVARQLVMWHLVRNIGMTYMEAGEAMGKNHATVMYSVRQIENIIALGRAYDRKVCEAALQLKRESDERED